MFAEGVFGRSRPQVGFVERLDLVALVAVELVYIATVMWPQNAVSWLCRPLGFLLAATEVAYFLAAYLFQSRPGWGSALWSCQGMRLVNVGIALGGVWVIAHEGGARGILEAVRVYDAKLVFPALVELVLFGLCLYSLVTSGRPVWELPLPDYSYRRGRA